MQAIPIAQRERVEPVRVDARTLVYAVGNTVGESPSWDARRGCLWWVDVRGQALLRLDVADNLITRWRFAETLGALALCNDGRIGLAMRHAIALFDPARETLQPFADIETGHPHNRLNDGKVSPSGRWWVVGSMDDRARDRTRRGSLYSISASGDVRRLHEGLAVANGIAWTLAGTRLYFSDSHHGEIFVADWNEHDGTLSDVLPFARSDEQAGRPDGATVDAADCYLSAGVSAGCLNRFDREGRLLDVIHLPCRAPTMPCFGGARGDELFVTSLWRAEWGSRDPFDGALIRIARFRDARVSAALWEIGRPA